MHASSARRHSNTRSEKRWCVALDSKRNRAMRWTAIGARPGDRRRARDRSDVGPRTSSALSDVGDAAVGTEGRDRRRDGRCGDGDDGGDARKKIVSMSSSSSDDRSVVASSSREADGDDVDDGGGARSIASRSIAREGWACARLGRAPRRDAVCASSAHRVASSSSSTSSSSSSSLVRPREGGARGWTRDSSVFES